jgi:ComF family protein
LSLLTLLKNDLVDFVFPKICLITDERLPEDNSNSFIKDDVLRGIEKADADDLVLLKAKINSDFFFSKFVFRHENEVQTLIHFLKYKGFSSIGTFLGTLLGETIKEKYSAELSRFGCIVPVPLFRTKERERGYNQSAFIGEGLNKSTGLELRNDIVFRRRYTQSQTGLSYKERVENVKDAFGIKVDFSPESVGNGILVVDDVITTGSTIKEVIRTLKENLNVKIGAVSVCIAKE